MKAYPVQTLLDHIIQLGEELERTPSITDIENSSGPSITTYQNRFGSWNNALLKAGFKPQESYTKKALIEHIKNLERKLGRTPRRVDIDRESGPHMDTYNRHFGSYDNAMKEAGLTPLKPYTILSDEDLVRLVKKAAIKLGHVPTLDEMDKLKGFPCASVYIERIGWKNALKRAGFDGKPKSFVPDEKLLQDIMVVANKKGHAPSYLEMEASGKYNPKTSAVRFGSWSKALETAGVGKFRKGYSEEQLFSEMARMLKRLGHLPTFDEMWHSDGPSPATYVNHFGSWSRAKEAFEQHKVNIPVLCKESGLEYLTVRRVFTDLMNNSYVNELNGGRNPRENLKIMRFIAENFEEICKRSNLASDKMPEILFDAEEELRILRLVDRKEAAAY